MPIASPKSVSMTPGALATTRSLLLALMIAATPASALGDEISDAVATLDPAITHVRVFGEWKTENAEGRYRVVIRREAEPGVIRFFVQRVGKDGTVVSSSELSEIRTEKMTVTDFNYDIDQFGLAMFIETGKDDASGTTYEVFFNDDGTYRFQPASN